MKTQTIQHKRGTPSNWAKATNYIPPDGELIIYRGDGLPTQLKVGDGKTLVKDLPFSTMTPVQIEELVNSLIGESGNGLSEAEVKELIDEALAGFNPPESGGGLTEDQVNALITEATVDFQPKLTAGDNITISPNNIISATIPTVPPQVLTEDTIKLANDLYTYVNIGKVSGSNLSPGVLGRAGESLKTVFNNLFGTQQDTQPTVTNNSSLSVNAGTTSYGGGEYGTAVSATDVTITFTLSNNSGTANYGYRYGQTKVTGSQTFYYPIVKQEEADIKITLPKGATAAVVANMGNLIKSEAETGSTTNNILYYNFNTSKKVQIKISLAADTVETTSQTRYGQISAIVKLGAAQIENQLTVGTAIDAFLTFLKNDATDTTLLSGGDKTGTAGAYTIAAGSYSPYYLASTSDELTSVPRNVATKFTLSENGVAITSAEESHIWFLMPPDTSGSKTIQYYALGQWYNFDGGTTGPVTVSLTLNSGAVASYKGYYTNNKAATGTTTFKIV